MSDQFPFGNRSKKDGSDDIEEIKALVKKYKGIIALIVIALVLVLLAKDSFQQVPTDSKAVVTRFGEMHRIQEGGLLITIPIIEEVFIVPTKRQMTEAFGFRTTQPAQKSTYLRNDDMTKESLMLTGDLNVAIIEWIVHYQINDPEKYLFSIRDARETLRVLSESTMREIVGDYSVTEVLTSGREDILQKAKVRLASLCEKYETGISVQRVELKDSAPPEPVKPSFNEVNQAEQEKDRKQNEALAIYNMEIPKAKGQAEQMIEEAKGYAIERVNMAKGDVAKFVAIQKEYESYPDVTRTRLYLETLNEVLGNVDKKIIVDDQLKGIMPMLLPTGGSASHAGMVGGVR